MKCLPFQSHSHTVSPEQLAKHTHRYKCVHIHKHKIIPLNSSKVVSLQIFQHVPTTFESIYKYYIYYVLAIYLSRQSPLLRDFSTVVTSYNPPSFKMSA